MANGSSRSHVNCVNTNLRADLVRVNAGHEHPRARYTSLLNPGVNRSNNHNTYLLSSPQPDHHNLPNLTGNQLRSSADVEPYTIQQRRQPESDSRYHSKLMPPSHRSSQVMPYELDQDTPTSSSSSGGSASLSTLGAPPLSSSKDESAFLTEILAHSPVTSGEPSEAGAYFQRLTSKTSLDHLPHVYRDQVRSFIPPAINTTQARQTTPSGVPSFSFPRSSAGTGAGSSQYVNSNSNSQSKKFPTADESSFNSDRQRSIKNSNTNPLVSSSSQVMTNSRPIRPLPAALSRSRHPDSPGVKGHNRSTRPQLDHTHNPKQSSSQSWSNVESGSAHGSAIARTVGKFPEGRSDDDPVNDDDRDIHDDHNASSDTEVPNKGKEKESEFDANELNPLKRKTDDLNNRKGTVGGPRTPSACDACKLSKVRCSFPDKPMKSGKPSDASIQTTEQLPSPSHNYTGRVFAGCERCILNGIECCVSGRKKRDPPPSQNELERKNNTLSMEILLLLFKLMSPDEGAANTSSLKKWKHRTEDSFVPSNSAPRHASSHLFIPQIPSSIPQYPKPTSAFSSPRSSRNLEIPNIPPGFNLADLPPLPVLYKDTSRIEKESQIEEWISKSTERLIKWDHAQSTTTLQPHKEADASNHPRWEEDLEVRYEQQEYDSAWNAVASSLKDDLDGTGYIDEDGDHVLNSSQILNATRAYVFGERRNDSLEDGHQLPQKRLPLILLDGVITLEDVSKLFDIFFDKINMFFSVCDQAIHSADKVLHSSHFLFTTICAVASKHYTERPELYPELLKYAKRAAGEAIHGPKTVETTQAFLLLGVYMPPSRTFKDDRAYLFFGLAIRNATDIELYSRQHTYEPLPSMSETEARRLLNRGRTWLNCFCNDRSISTQLGKATAILIRGPAIPFNLKTWWRSSKWNLPSDIHMCAYADLLSVPLNLDLVQEYADKVSAVIQTWTDIISSNFPNRTNIKLAWRDNLWPFLGFYAKLVVLSIGLRHGMLQGLTDKNPFSEQSIVVACELLTQVIDRLAKLGYMRYCVEAYFVFMGFAAAFLLKVLRRKFSFMRKPGQETEIINLIQRLIDLLGSDEVAIDNRHTPKLYSRFLADILAQHKKTQMKQFFKLGQNVDGSVSSQYEGMTIVQDGASSSVNAQPMEDVETYMYSQSGSQSQSYLDPALNAMYNNYSSDISPAMDLDIPLPVSYTNEQDTLLSMLPLRDPTFWEHPGMPMATNPDAWPAIVDMTHGTGGLYNLNPFPNDLANYQTYGSETQIPPGQYYPQYF